MKKFTFAFVFIGFIFSPVFGQSGNSPYVEKKLGQVQAITAPPNSALKIDDNSAVAMLKWAMQSNVSEGLMLGLSVLAIFFLLMDVISIVKKVVVDSKPLPVSDVTRLGAMIVLIIFYQPLLALIDTGMQGILALIENANPSTVASKSFDNYFIPMGLLRSFDIKSIVMEVAAYGVMGLDWVVSKLFNYYAMIALFIVQVFGPLALVFSLFEIFRKMFVTWLTLLFKFYIYFMVLSMGQAMAVSMLDVPLAGVTDAGIPVEVWLPIAGIVLLFKVMWNILGFGVIDKLFSGSSAGSGLGNMVGGLAGTAVSVVSSGGPASAAIANKAKQLGSGARKLAGG